MISALLAVLGSGGFGSVIGLAGAFFTRWQERKKLESDRAYQIEMAKIRAQEGDAERAHELAMAQHQVDRSESEGQIAVDLSEAAAFMESVKSQKNIKHGALASAVRPMITVASMLLIAWMFWEVNHIVGGLLAIPLEELMEIYKHLVYSMVFIATTALTWWFGARPSGTRKGDK